MHVTIVVCMSHYIHVRINPRRYFYELDSSKLYIFSFVYSSENFNSIIYLLCHYFREKSYLVYKFLFDLDLIIVFQISRIMSLSFAPSFKYVTLSLYCQS